jgi:hypothetical protein
MMNHIIYLYHLHCGVNLSRLFAYNAIGTIPHSLYGITSEKVTARPIAPRIIGRPAAHRVLTQSKNDLNDELHR